MPGQLRVRTSSSKGKPVGPILESSTAQEPIAVHVKLEAPAHERVDDQVYGVDAETANGFSPGVREQDFEALLALSDHRDVQGFQRLVSSFGEPYRGQLQREMIRHHEFDALPLVLQAALSPNTPFHQESKIDPSGVIICTTAVRIEGVTAADALRALTTTDWKQWWATSTTSGPPPTFDFVPEAPLKAVPGFHLTVRLGEPIADGAHWRLPVKLAGTVSGDAKIYVESVDGGVVVHDTWLGVKLSNFVMEHVGGVGLWTAGHLASLRGAMFRGMLGATGFAGLRKHLQGAAK